MTLQDEPWQRILMDIALRERDQRYADWDATDLKAAALIAASTALLGAVGALEAHLLPASQIAGFAGALGSLLFALRAAWPRATNRLDTALLLNELWAKPEPVRHEALSLTLAHQQEHIDTVLESKGVAQSRAVRLLAVTVASIGILEFLDLLSRLGVLEALLAA